MTQPILLLGLLAQAALAGVIHGVALEHATGLPLARARVWLDASVGDRLAPAASTLTTRSGQFVFPSVAAGHYLLWATRTGFAIGRNGQKCSGCPGTPLVVSDDSVTFIEMRLKRYGAISGKVLDENRVGLPGLTVVAYRAALPLRMAASAKSDDRGMYRIPGLTPGRYYVRTAAHELEDRSGLLPTFAPESSSARDAAIYAADLDTEVPEVSVYPLPGRLFRLSGIITGCAGMATVTLSSDTGRQQASVPCSGKYTFEPLSPGYYEILAELGKGETGMAVHQELYLDREEQGVNLQLRPLPWVRLEVRERDGGPLRPSETPILARRKDLAGEGEVIRITEDATRLSPGFWEISAMPGPKRYLDSVSSVTGRRRASRAGQHPDWFEVYVETADRAWIRVMLSPRPATLTGKVSSGPDPAALAPVYLWPTSPETRRRMNGSKTAYTDTRGMYRFEGLAPGDYLVLSSFDLGEVTEEVLTNARAPSLSISEGADAVRDVGLYKLP